MAADRWLSLEIAIAGLQAGNLRRDLEDLPADKRVKHLRDVLAVVEAAIGELKEEVVKPKKRSDARAAAARLGLKKPPPKNRPALKVIKDA